MYRKKYLFTAYSGLCLNKCLENSISLTYMILFPPIGRISPMWLKMELIFLIEAKEHTVGCFNWSMYDCIKYWLKVWLRILSVCKHHFRVNILLRLISHASNVIVYLRGLLIISDNTKHFLYHEFAVFCLVCFTLVFSYKIAVKGLFWQSRTPKTQIFLANFMVILYPVYSY